MRERTRGFTLLEMMLVIVLLGVSCSLLLPNLARSQDPLREERDRLFDTLQFILKYAELDNRVYGLVVEPHRWQVRVLVKSHSGSDPAALLPEHTWQTMSHRNRRLLRELPAGLSLTLSAEGQEIPPSGIGQQPPILFFGGGATPAFQLTLTDRESQSIQSLRVSHEGRIERDIESTGR